MSYSEKLLLIDQLQEKINSYGEFSPEVKKKINYRFRLDWNYYSNAMEGGTLTMAETRSVMVGNLTVGGKPIRDVIEMQGHDEVITEIMRMGKGEVRLSEKRIKDIHKAIIHEENEEKKKLVGQWKIEPNEIINYKKEKFGFAAPSEVEEAMHKLLNDTNTKVDAIRNKKKDAPHPVEVAIGFHLTYLTIHPFYDGNGRTARILTNLLLISFGYPPIIIKESDKQAYYQYLADIQGYGGSPDLYYEFMAGLLIRSQQLVLNALEGKSIEEPSDFDKKLTLLKQKLKGNTDYVQLTWGAEIQQTIFNTFFARFLQKMAVQNEKLSQLFTSYRISISTEEFEIGPLWKDPDGEQKLEEEVKKFFLGNQRNLKIAYRFHHFKLRTNSFDAISFLHFNFNPLDLKLSHEVSDSYNDFFRDSQWPFTEVVSYKEKYTDEEIDAIILKISNGMLDYIEQKSSD